MAFPPFAKGASIRLIAIAAVVGLLASPASPNTSQPGQHTMLLFNGHQRRPEKIGVEFDEPGQVVFRNRGTWAAHGGALGGEGNYAFSSKYLRGYGTIPTENGKTAVFNFFFDVDTGYG